MPLAVLLRPVSALFPRLAAGLCGDNQPHARGTWDNGISFFQNITLSSVGAGFDGDFDTNIFSINPSTQALEPYSASTGRLVFGTNDGTFPHLFGGFGGAKMRIDFGVSDVKLVLLDGISNNGSDIARLQAFDSTNTILGTHTTAALALSQFETMSVTSAAGNIAYVLKLMPLSQVIRFRPPRWVCRRPDACRWRSCFGPFPPFFRALPPDYVATTSLMPEEPGTTG